MRPVVTVVPLSVCLTMSCAKMAEPIKVPFRVWTRMDPREGAIFGDMSWPIENTHTHTHLTAIFKDYLGKPVPER